MKLWRSGLLITIVVLAAAKLVQLAGVWLSADSLYSDDVFSQVSYLASCPAIGSFPNDYLAEYAFEALLPPGYRAVFCSLASVVHPYQLARLLTICLVLLWLASMLLAAYRSGGFETMLLCLVFSVTADFQLLQISDGLPHSFSIPLLGFFIFAALERREGLLWLSVILSAACYPILAPCFGLYLLLHFVLERFEKPLEFSTSRALLLLVSAAVAAVLLVLPNLLLNDYGVRIHGDMLQQYPEAAAGGRYDSYSTPPFPPLWKEILTAFRYTFFHDGSFLYPALERLPSVDAKILELPMLLLCCCGFLFVSVVHRRRLLLLLSCASVHFFVALAHYPHLYFPGRVIEHMVSVLVLLLLPLGINGVLQRVFSSESLRAGLVSSIVLLCMVFDGVFIPIRLYSEADRGLFEHLASIQRDAVIAAWPEGRADKIPYVSERSVYLSYETHQVLHTEYTEEMRKRTWELIDFFFAGDARALSAMQSAGVTHVLLEAMALEHAEYFPPFAEKIAALKTKISLPRLRELLHSRAELSVEGEGYQLFRLREAKSEESQKRR